MTVTIGRRELLAALGGAAAAWPLAARAQQPERMRRIGLLMVADDREGQARVRALKQGLQELGWTEGRNIQIEIRFAGADAGRMRADAAELVALAPDVLVGNTTPVGATAGNQLHTQQLRGIRDPAYKQMARLRSGPKFFLEQEKRP